MVNDPYGMVLDEGVLTEQEQEILTAESDSENAKR